MALKSALFAAVGIGLLALSGASMADQYLPDESLGLDLSKAVLSPKPLGPPTEFAPVPFEAKADSGGETAQARVEPKARPRIVLHKTPANRVAHLGAEKPRMAARTKLPRRHRHPPD